MEVSSSPYAPIDGAIQRWVERYHLSLGREWQGEARFWYTSRQNECFQISIERPVNWFVTVHAWSVDTEDDAELHGEWSVDIHHFDRALTVATELIDLWAGRARIVR